MVAVGVLGRRAFALLAGCSAVLHGVLLLRATTIASAAVMGAMLVACLICAGELWVRGTLRAWSLVAVMNLVMIAIHLPAPGAHHHGGGGMGDMTVHHSSVMTLATAISAIEIVCATAVLLYRTRFASSTSRVDHRPFETPRQEVDGASR